MILPVIVLVSWLAVYRYWLVGSITIQIGAPPVGNGLLPEAVGSACNCPFAVLIVNAEIELFGWVIFDGP